MENDLTVVVNSFDGYSDLWPYFFQLFDLYWKDCPYNVVLVSNYKDYCEVQTIKTGDKVDWVSRTLEALNRINTPYVMLLLEDYFLSKKIEKKKITKIESFLLSNDIRYLRLVEIPKSKTKSKSSIIPILSCEEYGINLQASIWKNTFLKSILMEIKCGSAWDFEIYLLKKVESSNKNALEGCFTLKNNVFGFHNAVLKGKWFRRELKYYRKKGIIIDYSKRGKLSFFEEKKFVIAQFLKRHLSVSARKRLKKMLRRFGFKFVSDV